MEIDPVDLTGQIEVPFQPEFDGTYSRIYKGTLNQSHVAVKLLKVVSRSTNTMRRKIRRERTVWARMNCPNVLPFHGLADDKMFQPFGALISPWCENGDLERYLNERQPAPTLQERVRLFQGIVNGVVYLHGQGVVHGDLKPNNVLLSDQLTPLICDFGLARICSADRDPGMTTTSEHTGTPRYLAPELVLLAGEAIPTVLSDVWAMGCVGLRVIFLRAPYDHQPNNIHGQISLDIKRGVPPCGDIEVSSSRERLLSDLLTRCWDPDPWARGSASLIQQELSRRTSTQPLRVRPSASQSQSQSQSSSLPMRTRVSPMEQDPSPSANPNVFGISRQLSSQTSPADRERMKRRRVALTDREREEQRGVVASRSLAEDHGFPLISSIEQWNSYPQISTSQIPLVNYFNDMPAYNLPLNSNLEPSGEDNGFPIAVGAERIVPNPLILPSDASSSQTIQDRIIYTPNWYISPVPDRLDMITTHEPDRGEQRSQPNEMFDYVPRSHRPLSNGAIQEQRSRIDDWESEYSSPTAPMEPPKGSSSRRRKPRR